ncbi:MAG: hypothetical protein U0941_25695 [Planctomycetaceae bacterium]
MAISMEFRRALRLRRLTMVVTVVGMNAIHAAHAGPPPKLGEEIEVIEVERIFQKAMVEADSEIELGVVRKLMDSELMFVRQVCELPPARRPAFRERADEIVDEVFKAVNRQTASSDILTLKARNLIQKKFLVEIEKISKEQAALYDTELKSRMAKVKEATILGLTALLDQELILTAEQRDTLHTTLSTKWKEEWEHWLLVANQEEENFPSFADKIVSRIITPAQRQIWRTIPKLDLAELQFEEVFLEIADIPEDSELIEENENYWMNSKS